MNNLFLNKEINSLTTATKSVLWQFVRGDISIRTFELWIYSNANNILMQTFGEDIYLELAMLDYKNEREMNDLKTSIYEFLIKLPEQCLCFTFYNNTRLYPFTEDNEQIALLKQIDLLKATTSIEDFSGNPPIYQSRWYHSGKLCYCMECKTWWFVIFEESDSDYYLVRLNQTDALLISQSPIWPNEHWPSNLRSWDSFLRLKFQSWNNLYIRKDMLTNTNNFLMNYSLNTSKYK